MGSPSLPANAVWKFGDQMKVEILQGNILKPGRAVQAVVSTDDNYLTMGSGVSAVLRAHAGSIESARPRLSVLSKRAVWWSPAVTDSKTFSM